MLRGCFALGLLLLICSGASAQQSFGPFIVDPDLPSVIVLNGELDDRSALEFRRALAAAPDTQIVALNSPGGSVQMGLLIAEEIHERHLSTIIPDGFVCASACSWVFFAGSGRLVEGKLGVHQISGAVEDNANTQLNLSDVVEALNRYGTSPKVLAIMLRTPADEMYFFSPEEVAELDINRSPEAEVSVSAGPIRVTPDDEKSAALKFVEEIIAAHAASNSEALAAVRGLYAARLSYFGKSMSLDEVILDKQSYFQRFPARTYRVQPDSIIATCNDHLCEVRGIYSWIVTGPKKSASGRATFNYIVDMNGKAKVVAESGDVIR